MCDLVAPEPISLFTCAHCDLQFDNVDEFDSHEKTHTVVVDDDANIVVDDDAQHEHEFVTQHGDGVYTVDTTLGDLVTDAALADNHCPQCQLTFADREMLREHMREMHHTQAVGGTSLTHEVMRKAMGGHQCQICGMAFQKPHLLQGHMHHDHGAQPEHQMIDYVCGTCHQTYNSRASLDQHECNIDGVTQHNSMASSSNVMTGEETDDMMVNVDGVTYECEKCREAFDTRPEADQHAAICSAGELFPSNTHYPQHVRRGGQTRDIVFVDDSFDDDDTSKVYYCEMCDLELRTPYSLREHMSTVHADPLSKPRYSCGRCRKTYATVNNLNLHIRKAHPDLLPHEQQQFCHACRRPVDSLATHQCAQAELVVEEGMRVVHMDEAEHEGGKVTHEETVVTGDGRSTTYTYVMTEAGEMDGHQVYHQDIKQGMIIDPQGVRPRGRPKRTSNIDDGPPYSCSMCSMTFQAQPSLTRHVQAVHSGNPPSVYKCPRPLCTRSYSSRGNLNFHLRSGHNIRRPFRCKVPTCGKSFSSRGEIDEHRNRGICGRPSQQRSSGRPRAPLYQRLPLLLPPQHEMMQLPDEPDEVHVVHKQQTIEPQMTPAHSSPRTPTAPLKLLYCSKGANPPIDGRNVPRPQSTATVWQPYPCQRCGKTFSTGDERMLHQEMHQK